MYMCWYMFINLIMCPYFNENFDIRNGPPKSFMYEMNKPKVEKPECSRPQICPIII